MAKVTYVKKAQVRTNKDGSVKSNLHCTKCGAEILPGERYSWAALRIGRSSIRKNACKLHSLRPSDLTTSDKLGTLYSAQEAVEDVCGSEGTTAEDIAQALTDAADQAQEAADGYNESADNIEEGFGHPTYQSEEIREKAQACEDWKYTLDTAVSDVENLDDDDYRDEAETEAAQEVYAALSPALGLESEEDALTDLHDDLVEWAKGEHEERFEALVEAKIAAAKREAAQEIAESAIYELSV